MTSVSRLVAIFAGLLLVFDLFVSLAARFSSVPYEVFFFSGFLAICAVCAFLIGRDAGPNTAGLGTAALAGAGVIIEWALSWFIGPDKPEVAAIPLTVLLMAVPAGYALGFVAGLVGLKASGAAA